MGWGKGAGSRIGMPCSLKPGGLELVPFSSITSLHVNILALVSGEVSAHGFLFQ